MRALLALYLLTLSATASSQTLNQPSPLERLSDVTQFGVPRDSQYIFCDGDCPERSIKHIAPAPAPRRAPQVMPVPVIEPPVTTDWLSHAKETPPASKPAAKRKARAKPKVEYVCKPVTPRR